MMIKLNKHGLISNRLIAPEFTVGNTFVEGGGTPEELAVLSLTNEQLAALSYIVNGEGRIVPVGEDGTFDTKIGHSYCIRHTDDLILHEAWLSNDENLYVKRYGSGQLLFFATSEKCKINDPSYIVTEVFRMAALNDFVDWSGIEHYQKWFREIEVELTELLGSRDKFVLEIINDNTLIIHTDRISDELMDAVKDTAEAIMPAAVTLVQYNHNLEISWQVMAPIPLDRMNKYDSLVTITPETMGGTEYQKDVYQITPELKDWFKKTIRYIDWWDARWDTNCYAYVFSNATKMVLSSLQWDSSVCIYLPKLQDGSF